MKKFIIVTCVVIITLAFIFTLAQWILTAVVAVKVIENPQAVAEGAGELVGTFLDAIKGK